MAEGLSTLLRDLLDRDRKIDKTPFNISWGHPCRSHAQARTDEGSRDGAVPRSSRRMLVRRHPLEGEFDLHPLSENL